MNDETRVFLNSLAGEQQADQAIEAMRNLADGLWAFYEKAVGEGFSVDQAFALTVALLQQIIGKGKQG